ncbi:uncharacterized protein BDR25DRAFT_357854 [Lindgomyces ingoldianus]|uniref:Uncharacterized protein n=1 Tax=Lindgomyces ingoldianus TaxID=673940 RepID=A0ACB6QME9_9PLEO|nr:uncharacterized protein BDR25DRAFT_357854 [Lindgomyces ingoldianus]KAF2468108.1 hypothetical protein BDR25DRAFT_357854 [Lindgomyces ingoldianus]
MGSVDNLTAWLLLLIFQSHFHLNYILLKTSTSRINALDLDARFKLLLFYAIKDSSTQTESLKDWAQWPGFSLLRREFTVEPQARGCLPMKLELMTLHILTLMHITEEALHH